MIKGEKRRAKSLLGMAVDFLDPATTSCGLMSPRWNLGDAVAVAPFMATVPYFSPTLLLDDVAPETWLFLDYEDDGRVLILTPKQYEAVYRPDPEDQGG